MVVVWHLACLWVKPPLVQILVVVANIQMRALKTEVKKAAWCLVLHNCDVGHYCSLVMIVFLLAFGEDYPQVIFFSLRKKKICLARPWIVP